MGTIAPAQVTLIEELRIYGEGSVAKRLDAVYSDLVVWCGARGKQLHMSNLSTILVGWKRSSDYPTGTLFTACANFVESFRLCV